VVFSWDIGPTWQVESDPENTSEVEVTFTAEGPEHTRVDLEHRNLDRHGPGWEGVAAGVGTDQGWPLYLDRISATNVDVIDTVDPSGMGDTWGRAYTPVAILGVGNFRNVLAVGDSIMAGIATNPIQSDERQGGFAQRAFLGKAGVVNIAYGGEFASQFVTRGGLRMQLAQFCTEALSNYGNNDIHNAGATFAAVAAALHGLSDIFICENGVMSLNVPISDARKGSRSTRHAHPLYLSHFNQLINALYGRRFSVQNPFSFWTKGEEVELLGATNLYPMIKETVTCWGYPNQTLRYPHSNHCGYCLPCIVRRVSMIASGMEGYDDQYVVDVFGSPDRLTEAQRRNVEDLAYFCRSFSTSSKTELLYRYPELVMIEADGDQSADDRVGKIIRVYKKFAAEFSSVANDRTRRRSKASLTSPQLNVPTRLRKRRLAACAGDAD